MNLKERIKEYFNRRSDHKAQQAIEELASHFQVMEHKGTLYLMLDNVAFATIDRLASAEEIVVQLTTARQAAINHKEA
jgi:hypothetical protein